MYSKGLLAYTSGWRLCDSMNNNAAVCDGDGEKSTPLVPEIWQHLYAYVIIK